MADAKTIPTIKQGDAYYIPVTLYFNGEKITADEIFCRCWKKLNSRLATRV